MKSILCVLGLIALIVLEGCGKVRQQASQVPTQESSEIVDTIETHDVIFESEGVNLAGTMYTPDDPHAALVIVHGSDSVPRMRQFAELLADQDILVLTYDKRGVGESGGTYAGPEVGTNNISVENLNLLAKDATAAVNLIHQENKDLPIGLIGFSQAGWIIPIAANNNPLIKFMVLFSCPTITTLEQLRFQFYTDGDTNFWNSHTEEDARHHTMNDPDRYQFAPTDPNEALSTLSIPGLWLFGERDIQIPVKICRENLDILKAQGKPYEYLLFPELGHNTGYSASTAPFDQAMQWVRAQSAKVNADQ